jgi:hypothetical protein
MAEHTPDARGGIPPEEAPGKSGGPWQWMAGVFIDPVATFREMGGVVAVPHPTIPEKRIDKSKWWLPLIVIFVVIIASAAYVIPNVVMDPDTLRDTMLDRGVPPEQLDQTIEMARSIGIPVAIAVQIIIQLAIVFGAAGLTHLVMKMSGAKGTFRHARAVVSYSMLIMTLGSVIKLPLMIAREDPFIETGLVVFFKDLEPSQWLYRILFAGFDIFTVWWAVVLGIGAAASYRASGAKGAAAAVVVWAVISLIFAALMGGGGGFGG